MEKCQGWALSGHVATYTNKNAVQNVFKIATAQIDRTLYLIKKNFKSLIESVKKFWKVEDSGIHVEQNSFIKKFKNSVEYKGSQYAFKCL